MDARTSTLFREIHKNTWLKRLSVDNKKVLVGPKKSERSWVVFCVHDDCEAVLEGYVEPRQAAQHTPEWTVPLQNALHVSHALIPSEHEYEFVITLPAEVIRFNAASWEIMQEWVDTLRQKLREMKILSPKENLYSKLPEIRAPLLPTRDPTSPLPAPPPVPAALVPGIERIIPVVAIALTTSPPSTTNTTTTITSPTAAPSTSSSITSTSSSSVSTQFPSPTTTTSSLPIAPTTTSCATTSNIVPPTSAMSNTLTQNLINMLSNPVSAYSHQLSNISSDASSVSLEDSFFFEDEIEEARPAYPVAGPSGLNGIANACESIAKATINNSVQSLAKTFANNVLADPNTCPNVDACETTEHVVLLEANETGPSSLESLTSSVFQGEPLIIPRPQTNRNSAREKTPAKRKASSKTINTVSTSTNSNLQPAANNPSTQTKPTDDHELLTTTTTSNASASNITIIQVSSPTVSTGPSTPAGPYSSVNNSLSSTIELADDQFKSNVQIIPSNIAPEPITQHDHIKQSNEHQVITVQVSGEPVASSGYGKIKKTNTNPTEAIASLSKILSTNTAITVATKSTTTTTLSNVSATAMNFGPITNIPIRNRKLSAEPSTSNNTSTVQLHYEQVFLGASSSGTGSSGAIAESSSIVVPASPKPIPKQRSASHADIHVNRINLLNESQVTPKSIVSVSVASATVTPAAAATKHSTNEPPNTTRSKPVSTKPNSSSNNNNQSNHTKSSSGGGTNAPRSTAKATPTTRNESRSSPLPAIRKFLTRGLTEVSITRQSRRDAAPTTARERGAPVSAQSSHPGGSIVVTNARTPANNAGTPQQTANEVREHRRRSSSHSDAQGMRGGRACNSNNNNQAIDQSSRRLNSPSRGKNGGSAISRLTLREQQVLELRKEMMHMGGVRIQLRRKDCIGSIALCDAFGAVWVCGWKQKDYPMLYNALHIGDQLVTVAGVNVGCMADVHKIIRNVTGLYIEFILRRLPFGRVYAIRREMDGQCLGLIRDGNTATIVDVVPKSLTARHGLPPKAQSCDGLSLTFWVLTEINGRPLNMFFKDNEVRDRLNAVGRDISILVQPADLIVKLKKQLKSMRSHKDYIVQ